MSEPIILPVRPGSITSRAKSDLRKAGVIVVEHENPSELKLIRPSSEVDSPTLLKSALLALCKESEKYGESSGKFQREAFTIALNEFLNPPIKA